MQDDAETGLITVQYCQTHCLLEFLGAISCCCHPTHPSFLLSLLIHDPLFMWWKRPNSRYREFLPINICSKWSETIKHKGQRIVGSRAKVPKMCLFSLVTRPKPNLPGIRSFGALKCAPTLPNPGLSADRLQYVLQFHLKLPIQDCGVYRSCFVCSMLKFPFYLLKMFYQHFFFLIWPNLNMCPVIIPTPVNTWLILYLIIFKTFVILIVFTGVFEPLFAIP